jgi:AcrR family transcriptional regulator
MVRLNTRERQKQIINASIEIIKDRGIQNLTMQKIAERIGITEQAVYRHFSSKLEILIAIVRYFDVCCSDIDCPGLSEEALCAVRKIERMGQNHLNYFHNHPAVATVIFSEEIFQNEKELAEVVTSALERRLNKMARLIEKGQVNGEFNNWISAEHMAHMLLGSMRLLITRWRLANFSFDIRESGEKLISDILSLFKSYVESEVSSLYIK